MHAAFVDIDNECLRRFKTSGTTATLAVVVGWELLVANVGDSCAYLDTGSEIIQVRALGARIWKVVWWRSGCKAVAEALSCVCLGDHTL